ncbi:MAG TPA: S9 family peptidase, partial [Verrucomicrobiae bacterium]|nr:S9 family peptidase [Verrucomicrobiae bacterium]
MSDDPNLWLEDVGGQKALSWVREQNAASTGKLESLPGFAAMDERLEGILNSRDRIPAVAKLGKYYYNFWRDDAHVRGVWRRTTLEEYKKANPAWETVLDLDQLASEEKENWVWHGYTVLEPDYDRCVIQLSRGGADAAVLREFDMTHRRFVAGGFTAPEAKMEVAWHNRDMLYIGTDFGPGSLTTSGYPRIIKEWRRGTPLSDAATIFEGEPGDVGLGISVDHDHGHVYEMIQRDVTFFSGETLLRRGTQWVKIDKPADAIVDTFDRFLLLRLRSDWSVNGKTFPAGALLAEDVNDYMQGGRDLAILFQPTERASLQAMTATQHYLVLTALDNVHSRPWLLRFTHGQWDGKPMTAPPFGTVSISGIDPNESDDYFMSLADFLTPSSLYLGVAGKPGMEKIKAVPALFNAEGLEIQQFDAKSKDGTRVPYFQVGRKGLRLDGNNITLLNGYGGFEISMLPSYNA